MNEKIQIEAIPNIPYIQPNDDIGELLLRSAQDAGIKFEDNDILCIASKAVSAAEGRRVILGEIEITAVAEEIQKKVPRKDPRAVQLMIDETGAPDGSRIEIGDNYIAGWLPNGLRLTSSGVDKDGPEGVYLLPEDADMSAKRIGQTILEATSKNVGVIITDSDGRIDKRGATQVAIGVYGVPPIRTTEHEESNKVKKNEETTCDMIAASAGLIMGQRGTNRPIVLIRGYQYDFNDQAKIGDSLVESNSLNSFVDKENE